MEHRGIRIDPAAITRTDVFTIEAKNDDISAPGQTVAAQAWLTGLKLFFNDTATTEIYTLSLHDALPISSDCAWNCWNTVSTVIRPRVLPPRDRKSTRLNSSHLGISYAVFCLKKKND